MDNFFFDKMSGGMNKKCISQFVNELFERDEDGNLLSTGLNNIEMTIIEKLQQQNLNSHVGMAMEERIVQEIKQGIETSILSVLARYNLLNSDK